MKISAFLTAATALILCSAQTIGADTLARWPPKQTVVLYNQNSNFGRGVVSDNFSSAMSSYDAIGADDFWVPAGQTWQITEVDVTGAYVDGTGPASSVVVTFWVGDAYPRRIVHHRDDSFTLSCTDNEGSFACTLPVNSRGRPVVRLRGGSGGTPYWLSVVANCDFINCGEWNWTTNTTVYASQAAWKNPGGGWGTPCEGWGVLSACFGTAADLAFTLIGFKKGS
ncbi:MAG TPA: hypothetical protein VKR31_05735 [Rhizomicrobium sp.]|nr:hypothetical protein [Rhizomicrobium sp.]